MYLLINNLIYILYKIVMHVFIYVLKQILMFANVCIEDLITEMEPSLSVYCSMCVPVSSCMFVSYCLMCDWVRKPAFTGVLSYKTAACFHLDKCATLNLTFSTGVLRKKCRW